MTSSKQVVTRVRRFKRDTAQRNKEVRQLLHWLEDQEKPQSRFAIEKHFDWKKGRSRSALLSLVSHNFVFVAGTEATPAGPKLHLYKAVDEYDPERLNFYLPTTPQMALRAGFKVYAEELYSAPPEFVVPQRYYLDTLLMGGIGPAPSITFNERQA